MYEENTVAVVIPAYNEAGFVGEVIDTIPRFVDRVYPVDDRSTDGTWAEIRAHARRANERAAESGPVADGSGGLQSPDGDGAGDFLSPDDAESSGTDDSADETDSTNPTSATNSTESAGSDSSEPADEAPAGPRVVPLRHDENRGVGAAIKTGYRRARADGVDMAVVMAGDGQMDPDYLPRILDPVIAGRADYAKGDRLAVEGYSDEMSNWRLFGNGLLTLLTRAASGYWSMTDPQNGYTAVSAEALDRLDLDSVFDDYGFANAMLVHLNVAGMRVADVPMPARYGEEDSGIRYSTFVPQLSALLAKGFAWRLAESLRRDARVFPLLYGLGAVGTVAGACATVRDLLDRSESASAPDQNNAEHREGNENNLKATKEDSQITMNTATTARPSGRGPLTTVVGLAATALAVVCDAAENEPLHVTVESDEDPADSGDENRRGSGEGVDR